MLSFQLLKNHAGLRLIGPHMTLKELHSVVHHVNDYSPIIQDREGFFMALAYDVRHAYEGRRTVLKPPAEYPEAGTVYGVEILWPVLLLQARMLRESLAYLPSTARLQAMAYSLEAVIEEGLRADFPEQSDELLAAYRRIDPSHPWAENKIHGRGAYFSLQTGAQRKGRLLNLLASLDPLYPSIYELRFANGERGLLSPTELDCLDDAEWVSPKW